MMGRAMDISRKTTLVLLVALAACGAAWAVPSNPYDSMFVSTSGGYSDQVIAQVTQQGGLYHYEYEVRFLDSYLNANSHLKAPLTTFSVGNLQNFDFTGAGNNGGFANNPQWGTGSANSVIWVNGNAPVGQTVRFWFDSVHPYREVNATLQGGRTAGGLTLGMAPEPASLAFLALGLAGTSGLYWRRLRRR